MDGSQNPRPNTPGWSASTLAAATEPPSDAEMPDGLHDSEMLDDAYPRILRYARTLARDPIEAEDLTQEVFLRAFRARDTLQDPQARLSWLYRIATHAWVDRVRQRARRPEESDDAVEEAELADAGPGLQQVIEQSDMSACVQDYLVALPDGYRAVLLLHDLHDLPGPQIAEMLDLSLATVKIRLHRARLKLRAALAAGCLFSHDERNVLICEPRD
jgi:RNA polymerase sigma-70 factor, ECF subfamily